MAAYLWFMPPGMLTAAGWLASCPPPPPPFGVTLLNTGQLSENMSGKSPVKQDELHSNTICAPLLVCVWIHGGRAGT